MSPVQTISHIEEFKKVQKEWNQLLQQSQENNIFLTWEWLFSWWEVFGENSRLFVLIVRNDDGKLVGAAPLFIRKTKYYKIPLRQLTFIGTGHSDRQDFIYEKSNEKIVFQILDKIIESKNIWDISVFEEIPKNSPTIEKLLHAKLKFELEDTSVCPFIKIDGNVKDFVERYSKNFKRDIKHKINRMGRYGQWMFTMQGEGIENSELVNQMEIVEENSRKNGSEKLFLDIKKNRLFLSNLCNLFKLNGIVDYSKISVDGKTIAYLFGFVYGDRYYAYNMAFDENFHEASPGKLLMNEKIKWCFGDGRRINEFDFLRGATHLKSLWASEDRKHVRAVLFNGAIKGEMLRWAVFMMRPALKKIRKSYTEQ